MAMVYNLFSFFLPVLTVPNAPAITNCGDTDTVIVSNTGTNYQVLIGWEEYSSNVADILDLPFKGRILLTGNANLIEINTNPDRNKKYDKVNNVVVNQTGSNNSVKYKLKLRFNKTQFLNIKKQNFMKKDYQN